MGGGRWKGKYSQRETHNHTLNYIHTAASRWNGMVLNTKESQTSHDRVEISKQKKCSKEAGCVLPGIPGKRPLNMTLHHGQTHRPLATATARLTPSPSPRTSPNPSPRQATRSDRGETWTCSRTAGSRRRSTLDMLADQRSLAYHHNNNVKVAKWQNGQLCAKCIKFIVYAPRCTAQNRFVVPCALRLYFRPICGQMLRRCVLRITQCSSSSA